jgi:hypothetical protein
VALTVINTPHSARTLGNSAAEPDRCVQIKRGGHGPPFSRVWISRVPRFVAEPELWHWDLRMADLRTNFFPRSLQQMVDDWRQSKATINFDHTEHKSSDRLSLHVRCGIHVSSQLNEAVCRLVCRDACAIHDPYRSFRNVIIIQLQAFSS